MDTESELLKVLLDKTPDNIYFKDRAGRFILANDAVARKFGLEKASDVVGKTDFDFFTPEFAEKYFQDEQAIFRTGKPLIGLEQREVWPGGRVTWSSSSKHPYFNSQGQVIGLFGITRDITDRKLAEESLAIKNEELERDLEMAAHLQDGLMPKACQSFTYPAAGPVLQIDLNAKNLPHSKISGDLIEVIPISPSQIGVFICDVMGHGIRSALVVSLIRGLISKVLNFAPMPAAFLSRLNDELFTILQRSNDELMYATACYAVFDLKQGILEFASAGHPIPIHLQTASVELLGNGVKHSGALGLMDGADFKLARLPLKLGDRVLFYTDGITDVFNAKSEQFGIEGLLESARKSLNLGAGEFLDQVVRSSLEFSKDGSFGDDVCLLLVDWREANQSH